jgi:hypothetical protein
MILSHSTCLFQQTLLALTGKIHNKKARKFSEEEKIKSKKLLIQFKTMQIPCSILNFLLCLKTPLSHS